MNQDEFRPLLEIGETQWLEWKADFPSGLIQGNKSPIWESGKAELLKDIIALANASGQTPSYLIYGVKDLKVERHVVGISKSFDDADFQQWAKNAFDPPPAFQYTEIGWSSSKTIGVFQIKKTSGYPHVIKENIGRIIHKGQVWFRTESQNDVALKSDLEKMFRGETPVQFMALNDSDLERVKKIYRDQGNEIEFALLEQEESRLLQGCKIASYPGTRQKIVVGRGKPELVMLLKPKGGNSQG
jgi:hypothetical protein